MNCLLDWREAYKGHAQLVNRRWTGLRAKGKARRSDARNACWPFALCPLPLALPDRGLQVQTANQPMQVVWMNAELLRRFGVITSGLLQRFQN